MEIPPEVIRRANQSFHRKIQQLFDERQDYDADALNTPAGWTSYRDGFYDKFFGIEPREGVSHLYFLGYDDSNEATSQVVESEPATGDGRHFLRQHRQK